MPSLFVPPSDNHPRDAIYVFLTPLVNHGRLTQPHYCTEGRFDVPGERFCVWKFVTQRNVSGTWEGAGNDDKYINIYRCPESEKAQAKDRGPFRKANHKKASVLRIVCTYRHSMVGSVYMPTMSPSCETSATGVAASVRRYTCRMYFLSRSSIKAKWPTYRKLSVNPHFFRVREN